MSRVSEARYVAAAGLREFRDPAVEFAVLRARLRDSTISPHVQEFLIQ